MVHLPIILSVQKALKCSQKCTEKFLKLPQSLHNVSTGTNFAKKYGPRCGSLLCSVCTWYWVIPQYFTCCGKDSLEELVVFNLAAIHYN